MSEKMKKEATEKEYKENPETRDTDRKEWNEIEDNEPIEFINFKEIGDSCEGIMHGSFTIKKYNTPCYTMHSTMNGELMGVTANAFLAQQLIKVKAGQTVYIEFIGTEDTGKGNPAKKFKVLVK